ncbi:hypothetical protein V5R04_10185 [Jonesiaceae bacterium BS-20]|uniref:Uncharacterized protein n=1 Tax=Jonesiaceae bacterium BS-20 TaxID=3120821 RepID=A0AAU7DQW9_9MICO
MTTVPTVKLSLPDKFAMNRYLTRLSLHIVGLPHRMERDIRHQLRIDITDAAQDIGMAQALKNLGTPRILAHDYLQAHGRPVPKVWTGLVVFALVLYGGLFAMISVLDGLIDGALAADPAATVAISKTWLLSTAEVQMTNGTLDNFGFTMTWWGLLLLFLVPLVATRFWRVWTKSAV